MDDGRTDLGSRERNEVLVGKSLGWDHDGLIPVFRLHFSTYHIPVLRLGRLCPLLLPRRLIIPTFLSIFLLLSLPLDWFDTSLMAHSILGLGQHLVHIDMHAILDALTMLCFPSIVNPALQREIDRFGAVESQIETSMVTFWIGDDKLILTVDEHIASNAGFSKTIGRDGHGFMADELIALFGI